MAFEPARTRRTSLSGSARNGVDIVDQISTSMYLPVTQSKSGEQFRDVPRTRDFTPPYPRADAYRAALGSWYGFLNTNEKLSRCSRECRDNEDDCCIAGLAEQMARSMLIDDQEEDELKAFSDEISEAEAGSLDKFSSPLSRKLENLKQAEYSWSTRVFNSRTRNSSSELLPPSLNHYYSWEDGWCPTPVQGNETSRSTTGDAATALKHRNLFALGSQEWDALNISTAVRSKTAPKISSEVQLSLKRLDSTRATSRPSCNRMSWNNSHPGCLNASHNRSPTEDDCTYSNMLWQQPFNQGHSSSWNRANKIQQHHAYNVKSCQSKSGVGRCSVSSPSHYRSVQLNGGGSGMRAVFLGGTGAGRESIGTGVFLPRGRGVGNESKRKPSCSTVLLPSRIVQVLNLQVEDIRSSPLVPSGVTRIASIPLKVPAPSRGLGVTGNINYADPKVVLPSEKFTFSTQAYQPSTESRLPSEWTY